MMWAALPENTGYDVFFKLSETGKLMPGQELEANLWCLSPELVIPLIRPGLKFNLWEGRTVAHGEVLAVTEVGLVKAFQEKRRKELNGS